MMNWFYSILSAVLLILSFPNFNFSFLVWIALAPLMFLIDGKKPLSAFGWAWFTGFLFFLATHYWIIHATLPGMFLFAAYLAVYFGLFGAGYSFLQKVSLRHQLWALPCLWVSLELIRDRFLSGFGWACLGHSQYQVLPIIQIADLAGVFGVSFLIVMVNVLIKSQGHMVTRSHGKLSTFPYKLETVSVFVVLVAVFVYGSLKLKEFVSWSDASMPVLVVQPNIPQSRDRVMMSADRVEERLFRLTREALSKAGASPKEKVGTVPTFVIWPESAVPNGLWSSPERYARMKKLVKKHNFQLLFGAVTLRDERYYNSAILLSPKGEAGISDKRHLVPFGEFLPLRPWLNFVEHYVPIGDFTPAREWTLFKPFAGEEGKFGVLICFEDTVAPMVRGMTASGASWLVNITNDGWFQDSNEPYLHLASSVLQAVANRRPIVRSANTGVSGIINADGTFDIFKNSEGRSVMAEGTMTVTVRPRNAVSFYTRYGDVFAFICAFFAVLGVINRKKLL